MRRIEAAVHAALQQPNDRKAIESRWANYRAWVDQVSVSDPGSAVPVQESTLGYQPMLVLKHPGPLYGFLRKHIGLSPQVAHQIDDEETEHFIRAQNHGMQPQIELNIVGNYDEEGNLIDDLERGIAVEVCYSFAGLTLGSGELLNAIRDIHDVPNRYSESDEEILRIINSAESKLEEQLSF